MLARKSSKSPGFSRAPASPRRELLGETHRDVDQIVQARRHFVDQPQLITLLRLHRLPGYDGIERGRYTDQAREPLRASCPRNDTQRHLRQADPGPGDRYPCVAAQRELEASAESCTVHRCHYRLG